MFIDKVRISVKAGAGGNGAVAFHREKYVAAGGPDGGDGGNGGSIVLHVDDNLSTLMDFRYKRKYSAPNGENGQGKRCRGKNGENLIIKVPRGTVVRDLATNEIIKDMSDSDDFVLCKGGRGGWGNQHFATPTRQVPRFAKAGLPGEEHDVILELKSGRCRPCRLPECRKINTLVRYVQRAPQNCKLPLYHTLSEPRRDLRCRRRFVCHGRYPRHY